MARKRKKVFRAEREARRIARERVGTPPPSRAIQDKRKKPPKHKKPVREDASS
jgi:hypothetical protein